jgi:hypothetical protein
MPLRPDHAPFCRFGDTIVIRDIAGSHFCHPGFVNGLNPSGILPQNRVFPSGQMLPAGRVKIGDRSDRWVKPHHGREPKEDCPPDQREEWRYPESDTAPREQEMCHDEDGLKNHCIRQVVVGKKDTKCRCPGPELDNKT